MRNRGDQKTMKPTRHNFPSIFFYSSLLITIFVIIPQTTKASDHNLYSQSYILNKLQSNDIVFLGTRHNQPPILKFISIIITELHNTGVTHIGLEIASDQQGKIEQFMKTGAGLNDLQIHSQIDCQEYRNLFKVIKDLDPNKRPKLVGLDLPKSKYKKKISRDEWMAKMIAAVFDSNSNAKILVVVGNNHILKKLDLKDHVVNRHGSIRQYLSKNRGEFRILSIGQVIGESVYEDDLRRDFGYIDGAVAVDLDERFAGWKLGIVESVAIKRGKVWELLDGLVVYQ
jgi:uncharacterized iron-regulated protein